MQKKIFHFSCAEPIGSAKPKFSSKMESVSFREMEGNALALLCPAQGTPLPAFR